MHVKSGCELLFSLIAPLNDRCERRVESGFGADHQLHVLYCVYFLTDSCVTREQVSAAADSHPRAISSRSGSSYVPEAADCVHTLD